MRRKVVFGFLPLCGLLAVLLPTAPADTPARSLLLSLDVKKGSKRVCPLYMIADHGSYTTWYAEICFGQYCPLDTTSGGPGDCHASPPDPKCVTVPGLAPLKAAAQPKKGGRGNNHIHSSIKGKVSKLTQAEIDKRKKANPDWPLSPAAKPFTTRVGEPVLVALQTSKKQTKVDDYARVLLFLSIVTPAGKTPVLMATGFEVDVKDKPDEVITIDRVTDADDQLKVCWVRYGPVTYQVVLDKDRKAGDPESGAP